MLASRRHALALAVEELEQERRHVLAPHRGALGGGQPVVQQPLVQGRVDLLVHRERVRDDDAAVVGAELAARAAITAATSAGESTRQSTR